MTTDDAKLAKARAHMTAVALGLAQALGPLDAAGVLMGAAQGVLVDNFGRETATRYLRELADETELAGDLGGAAGHA